MHMTRLFSILSAAVAAGFAALLPLEALAAAPRSAVLEGPNPRQVFWAAGLVAFFLSPASIVWPNNVPNGTCDKKLFHRGAYGGTMP